MTAKIPVDSHVVSDTGHTTDHNDIVDVLTLVTGTPADNTTLVTTQKMIDTLAGATTTGQYLRGNGTHVTMSAIPVGDLPAGATPQGLWQPSVNGLLAATMDMDVALLNDSNGIGANPSTGVLYLAQLLTYTSVTFSKVWLAQHSAATTPTYMAIGVYNFSGTRVAATANQSGTGWTAFQSGVSLGGSVTASPAAPVWLGLLVVAASGPGQVIGVQNGFGTADPNLNLSASTYRLATNGSGLSTLPASITPASNGTFPVPILPWIGVS